MKWSPNGHLPFISPPRRASIIDPELPNFHIFFWLVRITQRFDRTEAHSGSTEPRRPSRLGGPSLALVTPDGSGQSILDSLARSIKAFPDLPAEARSLIMERGKRHHFAPGTPLALQGEPSCSLYILLDGLVKIERSHPAFREPLPVAKLGPGATVGAMELLEGIPRPTSAIAITDCDALEVDAVMVADLIVNFPVVSRGLMILAS